MSPRPRLLLFDIDGTLVLTGGAGRRAMARAFEEICGLPDAMVGVDLGGRTDRGIARQVFAHYEMQWDSKRAEEVFARYLQLLEPEVAQAPNYQVLPGVKPLIESLATMEDVWLGLGTGNLEAAARVKLARGALDVHFGYGGYGSDAEDRTELLGHAVRRGMHYAGLGRDALDVVVIGDTPRDISAARDIGARVVAVATGVPTRSELEVARPDALFDTLADPGVIGELLS